MHFQSKLLEILDEILQVSEELQTQIFSNFIPSTCKFQISSSHHVLCWGSTCPYSNFFLEIKSEDLHLEPKITATAEAQCFQALVKCSLSTRSFQQYFWLFFHDEV
jgi:hypothetical protein